MDSDDQYDTPERYKALMDILEGLERYHIDPSCIKIAEVIGEGGYGRVSKATWHTTGAEDGDQVAVKEIFPKQHKPVRLALSTFDHPHILKFLGFHLDMDDRTLYLVAPYLAGGSVRQCLNNKSVSMDTRKRWVLNATSGLKYLHSMKPPVVHGDLKADNLLVTDSGDAVLCDFGLSSVMEDSALTGLTASDGFKGSVQWCSPELLHGSRRTTASDVWAWALCVLEIMTGCIPFDQQVNEVAVLTRLAITKIPPPFDDYPELPEDNPLWISILGCLPFHPSERFAIDGLWTNVATACGETVTTPQFNPNNLDALSVSGGLHGSLSQGQAFTSKPKLFRRLLGLARTTVVDPPTSGRYNTLRRSSPTRSNSVDLARTITVTAPERSIAGPTDHLLKCSGCSAPIIGVRYQCLNCPSYPVSYNLCRECERTSFIIHPFPHVFIKFNRRVDRPLQSPQSLLPTLYVVPPGGIDFADSIENIRRLVHDNTYCDECMTPIAGAWFRCIYCGSDMRDLHEATHDSDHCFIIFKSQVNLAVLSQITDFDNPSDNEPLFHPVYDTSS